MRAHDVVAEAIRKATRDTLESLARAFKRVLSREEIADVERHAHGDSGGPVAAHQRFVVPVFHVCGDAFQHARFEARFEAVEVRSEAIVVVVVAGENACLCDVFESGNEEADLGIESFESRLESREFRAFGRLRDAARHEPAAGAARAAPAHAKCVVLGHVVVQARVHPLREQFESEPELVQVVAVLAVDVVPKDVGTHDDFVAQHLPESDAEAGDKLAAVFVVEAGV